VSRCKSTRPVCPYCGARRGEKPESGITLPVLIESVARYLTSGACDERGEEYAASLRHYLDPDKGTK
jgi:hypothetical protein